MQVVQMHFQSGLLKAPLNLLVIQLEHSRRARVTGMEDLRCCPIRRLVPLQIGTQFLTIKFVSVVEMTPLPTHTTLAW